MSQFKFFLIFVVLCTLAVLGNGDVTLPPTSTIHLSVSSGLSSTTQSSNTADSSLSSAGTSSNSPVPPVGTASLPSDPATKAVPSLSPDPLNTTTTSSTTTTTTPKPTPAPTPAPTPNPTPAPAPKPLPPPEPGMWTYTDNATNVTCILVQFAAQLNVTYTKENSNTTDHFQLNVPKSATVVNGSCANATQWIKLSWPAATNLNSTNSMLLVFQVNVTTEWYELKSLNVSLVPEVFHNSSFKDAVELWHGVEWHSLVATSYRCTPPTYLNMTSEVANVVAKLTLSQLQEEAFRTGKNKDFSAARECGGGDLPDAVPIAVGCALGGLVIVVLVAYLVGRRRSAARGYVSM